MLQLTKLSIPILLALPLNLASAENVRTWTNQQGQSVDAKFVRIHGENVILQKGRKAIPVPLSSLTEADQRFARARHAASQRRHWSYEGKSVQGKYAGFSNGNAKVRVAGKVVEIPYAKLAADSKDFVHDQLEAYGQLGLLPGEAQDDRFSDAQPLIQAAQSEGEEQDRQWTDSRGRKTTARLVSAKEDRVVLLYKGKEYSLPLSKFSSTDQQYVQGWLSKQQSDATAKLDPHSDAEGAEALANMLQQAMHQPTGHSEEVDDIDQEFARFQQRMYELRDEVNN